MWLCYAFYLQITIHIVQCSIQWQCLVTEAYGLHGVIMSFGYCHQTITHGHVHYNCIQKWSWTMSTKNTWPASFIAMCNPPDISLSFSLTVFSSNKHQHYSLGGNPRPPLQGRAENGCRRSIGLFSPSKRNLGAKHSRVWFNSSKQVRCENVLKAKPSLFHNVLSQWGLERCCWCLSAFHLVIPELQNLSSLCLSAKAWLSLSVPSFTLLFISHPTHSHLKGPKPNNTHTQTHKASSAFRPKSWRISYVRQRNIESIQQI